MPSIMDFFRKTLVIFEFEARKIKHDPTELIIRSIQPVLWLVIFGSVFTRMRTLSTTDGVDYKTFLAPGIMCQSVMFVAIFFGIAMTFDRDNGILSKIMVTPTSRMSITLGKALSAGFRGLIQSTVIVIVALAMGVRFTTNPLAYLAVILVILVAASTFACISIFIASLLKQRERFMGIIQLITMPMFFASSALYPLSVMPSWLKWVTRFNPLYYMVDALRELLVYGSFKTLPLDLSVLLGVCALFTYLGSRALKKLVG